MKSNGWGSAILRLQEAFMADKVPGLAQDNLNQIRVGFVGWL